MEQKQQAGKCRAGTPGVLSRWMQWKMNARMNRKIRGGLIVASGGGSQHPDWHGNLMAHPERASIELPGRDAMPVTPHQLDGADREQAWQRIAAAQPRIATYQSKSDREYPVIRLSPR